MDKIDLNVLFDTHCIAYKYTGNISKEEVIDCMIQAIHQALVLASEKGRIIVESENNTWANDYTDYMVIDKQSILNIEKLII